MEIIELLDIISRGESSKIQFKVNVHNANSLGQEMIAFSNSGGGKIIIGVDDKDWSVKGLSQSDVGKINQHISNAATQSVRPPINPTTENIKHPDGLVIVVTIHDGLSKPYMDNQGAIWVKNGSDKRKVTSREELQRLFQSVGLVSGDKVPVKEMTTNDIDLTYFKDSFNKIFSEDFEDQEQSLPTILENMNLSQKGNINVAGTLLFAAKPNLKLPTFILKGIVFPGNEIDVETYIDSRDIVGKVSDIFQHTISFIMTNIRHVQLNQNINSVGIPEIPKIVFEELVANAIIHRDYFVPAPIRVFIFSNRIEIISPGHLPNNLTIENIKAGNSNVRNPILASYATKILPYRGLGSGIIRAIKAYPDIEFIDDRDGNLFKVIIKRKQ